MQEVQEAVRHATAVAKIALNREAKERLAKELAGFKRWLEPLLAVDTAGSDPLPYSHEAVSVFREDKPVAGETGELQRSVSHFAEGFYRVPAIID